MRMRAETGLGWLGFGLGLLRRESCIDVGLAVHDGMRMKGEIFYVSRRRWGLATIKTILL